MKTSAQQLLGETLEGGWKVVEHLDLQNVTTGGTFSESYIVVDEKGRRAFLKALDYDRVLRFAPDPALRLKELTEAYLYERELLRRCSSRRLDRVVMPVADGTLRVPGAGGAGVVQYLILELGDGDLRVQASRIGRLDLALTLRALHHMATGLNQLHGINVAHQDLKPSNVVVFDARIFKVGDLGSAASRDREAPHDDRQVVGDPAYAPPELLYRHIESDWNRRRFGCDAYLLGSMALFCFSGLGVTASIKSMLDPAHSWTSWTGRYVDVVPHLRDALEKALSDVKPTIHPDVGSSVVDAIRELCEPDPTLRGDPQSRGGGRMQFRLDKYVSRFDLLARKAELTLVGVKL